MRKVVTVQEIAQSLSRWIKSDCPCTCKSCERLRKETGGVSIQLPASGNGMAKLFDVFFNGRKT